MIKTIKNISSRFAYDISKNPISVGEVWDKDAINQSIEMIINTIPGERIFNPSFGSPLQYRLFNVATPDEGNLLLNEIAESIKRWEYRVTLIESDMRIIVNEDDHSVVLIIPYIINKVGIGSTFSKKIYSN
jgi:phage baseplate assembly protein W